MEEREGLETTNETNNTIEPFEIESDDTPILKNDNGKLTLYLISCLAIASIGAGFQFGWNLAVLNNPSEVIKNFFREVFKSNYGYDISNSTLNTYWAITNGLLPIGGTVSSLLSGFIADSLGRKNGLVIVNILMIVSSILAFTSKYISSIYVFMVSRFLSGLYLGISNTILPIYLSECSSNNFRGWAGTMIQLSVVSGVLTAQILGLPQILGTRELWHVLVGLSIVPALVECIHLFCCETPKYILVFLNDRLAAQKVLMRLRGGDIEEVNLELKELEEEKVALESVPSWKRFLTDKILFRATVVAVMIQIAQQLCGVNAFTFYSTQIFLSTGLTISEAALVTIVASATDVGFTLISMNLVDKTGRKPLLIWSAIGMFFSMNFIALIRIFMVEKNPVYTSYLAIVSYAAYQISFSLGFGPIPKYISAELFVSSARGRGGSIAFYFHWLFVSIVVLGFPLIDQIIGVYTLFIFAGFLVFITLYMVYLVPETKNRPVDKIVAQFKDKWLFK